MASDNQLKHVDGPPSTQSDYLDRGMLAHPLESPEKPEPRERVALAWTGGWDSTALLLRYLKEGKHVTTISAELANNVRQVAAERRARTVISGLLLERFPGQLDATVFEIPTINLLREMEVIQPYLWLTQLPLQCKHDKIALGYVQHDCFWHFKEFARKTQEALNGFARDKFEFLFPLEWSYKEDLAADYAGQEDIVAHLSVCEDGNPWMTCTRSVCEKCPKMRKLWATTMGMEILEKNAVQTHRAIRERREQYLFDETAGDTKTVDDSRMLKPVRSP